MKRVHFICLALLAGCGTTSSTGYEESADRPVRMAVTPNLSRSNADSFIGSAAAERAAGGQIAGEANGEFQSSATAIPQAAERRIIYTASLSLVVDDFDGLEKQIRETVKQHQGYLSRSDLGRMQGQQRSGNWTARIPVDQYETFIQAVSALGVPASLIQNAADITEEFVDITARIDNKRKLEARILQLLERPEDKIQHVIEVETELARVREEIERMEGRLRYISDQTAMTTVNIDAREERNYQPPQALTLGNRISTAWSNSLEHTIQIFQNTLVFLVRNAIGIVAWIVGLTFGWIVFRFVWRRFRGVPAQEY